MTTRFAQRFVLEREIGSGGMARVFLGRDAILERPVAIKILKPGHDDTDIAARFRREGRTAARLSHPNIVQVYDAGEDVFEGREASYIVMEYVPGGDLKSLIDEKGCLSNKELAQLGAGIAAGLANAHEGGIVHRDVKPHNVMLDDRDRPKLSDFGIARALDATQATRTGAYLGTALYSSPEQLKGERVTPKSDVYSLGVTFYQAATGETPFEGSPITVAHQHVSNLPTPPRELNGAVDRDLNDLILDCMSKDPVRRPTADEVRIRLLEAGRGTYPTRVAAAAPAASATSPTATGRTRAAPTDASWDTLRAAPPADERRGGRRRRSLLLLTAAALLLILLGVSAAYTALDGGGATNTSQNPPAEEQPVDNQPVDNQPVDNQSPESQPVGGQPVQEQPAEEQPVEEQPAGEQPMEQPVDSQPAEEQPANQSEDGSQAPAPEPQPQAEETPAEDEQVNTGSDSGSLSEEAAGQTVEQVYETAEAGDFDTSFGLLSQGFRQREGVTSPETWAGTFEGLESLSFEAGPDAQVSDDGTATVTGVTIAEFSDRTERNTVTWTLVDEGGEWKFDDLTLNDQQFI